MTNLRVIKTNTDDISDTEIKKIIMSRPGRIVTIGRIKKLISDIYNVDFDDHASRSLSVRIGMILSILEGQGKIEYFGTWTNHRRFRVKKEDEIKPS